MRMTSTAFVLIFALSSMAERETPVHSAFPTAPSGTATATMTAIAAAPGMAAVIAASSSRPPGRTLTFVAAVPNGADPNTIYIDVKNGDQTIHVSNQVTTGADGSRTYYVVVDYGDEMDDDEGPGEGTAGRPRFVPRAAVGP